MVKVLVNGKNSKFSKKIKQGDRVEIFYIDPPSPTLKAEKIKLHFIYEDENVIVINKQQGLVVHPACGHYSGTLVNGLLYHCSEVCALYDGQNLRPGIVHRLDKDTSGVIITAKNLNTLEFLSRQFRRSLVKKLYIAIVDRKLPARQGLVKTIIHRHPVHRKLFACSSINETTVINGKKAFTKYRVLKEWDKVSLLSLKPYTGRTHQLRVHMKYLGCPIVGDTLYSKKHLYYSYGLMLHAYKLRIKLPGKDTPQVFKAPLPGRFRQFLKKIEEHC